MKKFMSVIFVAVILTLVLSYAAFAQDTTAFTPTSWALARPDGAVKVDAYTLVDGVWKANYVDNNEDSIRPGEQVRAYTSGNGYSGHCDKFVWGPYAITNHASVAQWVNFNLTADRWDWEVRKWGTFAADCMAFNIQSNGDVMIDFDGFDNLANAQGYAPIEVAYNIGCTEAPTSWYTPAQLNAAQIVLPYNMIKTNQTYKLWNKINVLQTTHACEYEDQGTFSLTVKEQKAWIDGSTGTWKAPVVAK